MAEQLHVGWRCEHYQMTRLPEIAPASQVINARCGCTMAPVYAEATADLMEET